LGREETEQEFDPGVQQMQPGREASIEAAESSGLHELASTTICGRQVSCLGKVFVSQTEGSKQIGREDFIGHLSKRGFQTPDERHKP
jgi:hypothetical protein